MKKAILLVALGMFVMQIAVAQQFRLGIGGGVMTQDVQSDGTYFLALSPGIYLPVSKRVSFSLDVPVKAGYTGGAPAPYSPGTYITIINQSLNTQNEKNPTSGCNSPLMHSFVVCATF